MGRRETRRSTRDQQTRRRTGVQEDQQTRRIAQDNGKVCSTDRITDRKQKRKHKCGSSHQGKTCHVSFQGSLDSVPHPDVPTESRTQQKLNKRSGSEGSRHPAVPPHHHPSCFGSDPLQRNSAEMADDNTDLSDGEKGSPLPSHVPPQLHLRPDVENWDVFSCSHRTRGQNCTEFHFPDFLPPPFNSWSLSQLAVFHSIECRGSQGPRPVDSLERYLERLLQLERHQVKTVHEETGTSQLSNCHRPSATASSRLSSPKCILQCQRGFPLSFLSCLAASQRATPGRPVASTGPLAASSHSSPTSRSVASCHLSPLSSCACTLRENRLLSCNTLCCHSSHTHHFRLSPMLEGSRAKVSLPRRSCSESRTPRLIFQQATSPERTSSHMRRMQASGNLRNLLQTGPSRLASTVREHSHCLNTLDRDWLWSGSEQRRSAVERKQKGSGTTRSRSECRGGGGKEAEGHYKRTTEFKHGEIKPDAVAAIKDNLHNSNTDRDLVRGIRSISVPILRTSRSKHVDLVR